MDTNIAAVTSVPAEVEGVRDLKAVICVDVHCETHDVKTFTFTSPQTKPLFFEAGQYLTFQMVIDGQQEARCYSISSSPHRTNNFSITVKRVVGGKVSNWLHEHLEVGMTLEAEGPFGAFVRPQRSVSKLLMLSAGSGITPLMSMLRDIEHSYDFCDIVFIHAARTLEDIIFKDELLCHSAKLKGLRLYWLPERVTRPSLWQGLAGRLTEPFLKLAVPDIAERAVLCCGPAPFMTAARNFATQLGVNIADYHEERFEAEIQETNLKPNSNNTTFHVSFSRQSRSIEVDSVSTILSAAKLKGVYLPSACANGMCGSCKSKLLSGNVDMQHAGGIRQREVDAGFFLPCCSKPLSDLVIDR